MSKKALELYEQAVISLITHKPFFAKVVMHMHKTFTRSIPTLAVGVNREGIKLLLNPDFLEDNSAHITTFLEHEVSHLIYDHLGKRFDSFRAENALLSNFAQDVAINQLIKNIPNIVRVRDEEGKIHDSFSATLENMRKSSPEAEPKMNAEYYYAEMMKNAPKIKMRCVDEHGEIESDLTEEQQKECVKGTLKAIKDACGSISREEEELLKDFFKNSQINWRSELRNFFSNGEETITEDTRSRRNRRYGIQYPGVKHIPKLHVAVAVDTSGSISDIELSQFFGEIQRIVEGSNTEVTVIEADCKIQNVYPFDRKKEIRPKGRGGTAFRPSFEKAVELGVDALIFFSDGDTSDIPDKPRFPVLWGMVRNGNAPVPWGRTIQIKVGEKE